MKVSYFVFYKNLDKGLFELIGPIGLEKIVEKNKKYLLKFQTGYIYHYAVSIVIFIFFMPILLLFLIYFPVYFKLFSLFFIVCYVHFFGEDGFTGDDFFNYWGLNIVYFIFYLIYISYV